MDGDEKAGELVRRVLSQQADMIGARGRAAAPVEDDELAKFRARRAAP